MKHPDRPTFKFPGVTGRMTSREWLRRVWSAAQTKKQERQK